MAKSARNSKQEPEIKKPVVIDTRPMESRLPRSVELGNPNIPIRTILYIEVGDAPSSRVQQALANIMQQYAENEHPHYCVPLRGGKLTSEIEFENEFLSTVRKLCEVVNGEIVLRGIAHDVDVIRKKI